MPLPTTRYLDAGPALPEASQAAAQATGDALSRFGSTIAAIGEKGFQIAERVRVAEETGKIAGYFSEIDQRAGEFSNELLSRADPENWPKEWRQKVEDFKSQATALPLSPQARASLNLKIQEWSTQRAIRFEGLSASRIVDEGRARLDIGLRQSIARGEREQAEDYISLMPGLGLMPSQVEEANISMERGLARQALAQDSATDPKGTLERVNDPSYLQQPGNEHLTLEDLDFARTQAQQQQRLSLASANAEFQDLAATGAIRTKEDLLAKWGDTLPPRVLEAMEADLAGRWNAQEQQRRATPAYQAETVGAVEAALVDLPLEIDKFPEKLVMVESLAQTLPPGAAQTRLLGRIRDVAEGRQQEFQSAADFAREDFTTAYKGEFFGKTPTETKTSVLLDNGYLRNPQNLLTDGYSQEQTEAITGKSFDADTMKSAGFTDAEIENFEDLTKNGKMTDAKRSELFRAFRPKRTGKSSLSGYKAKIAHAIAHEQSTVPGSDPEKNPQSTLRLGQAVSEFDKWIAANPSKVDDFDAVQAKKDEILGRHTVKDFAAEFLTPGVLPPRPSASDFVPNFLEE